MLYMDKVEEYYAKKHAKGRALKSVVDNPAYGALYQFEKCEPAEYYYKVEYCEAEELEAYTALLTDCGWEYVCAMPPDVLYVFRKPADGEFDLALFDESELKAREYENSIKRKKGWYWGFCILVVFMAASVFISILLPLIRGTDNENSNFPWSFLPLYTFYSVMFLMQRGEMKRLKKSVAMLRGAASADKLRQIGIKKATG